MKLTESLKGYFLILLLSFVLFQFIAAIFAEGNETLSGQYNLTDIQLRFPEHSYEIGEEGSFQIRSPILTS